MKKVVYIGVFLALAICTSCRDRSYQGLDPITPEEEIEIEQVPILLAVGDPSYSILTRSLGTFDSLMVGQADTLVRNKATFYIYAFAKDDNVDFSVRANDTDHNPDKDICLVDGTLNKATPEYDHGKTAVFNRDDYAFLNWADGAAYYNTVHQTLPYNFYAYYVDSLIINKQLPGGVERSKDYIAFPVKIDGRMDLMSAIAAVTEDQQKDILDKITNEKDKKAMSQYRYSAYTAHRGLYPFFTFKHHMAKMTFKLYAGDSICKRVFLDTIQVKVNTVGKFTVAHKDESQIGITDWNTPKWLLLKEKDGSDLRQDYQAIWDTKYNGKEIYDRPPTPVGDCLLIPPSDSIDIEIYFRQKEKVKEGEEKTETRYFVTRQTINPKDKHGNNIPFEAGHAYNLRIAVFGELEIKISAAIEAWKPGGDIDINPDANFQY